MTAKPVRQYIYRMFVILPLTFLFTPLFYSILGYHPDIPAFPLIVYLWYAIFIFFGATIAVVLDKYKYLAYPIIFGIAFLCKNIITLPGFNFQQTMLLDFTESGEEILIIAPLTSEQIIYYTYVFFITMAIAGIIGISYSKKSAFDLGNKQNTIFFFYVLVISSIYYSISGIMDIDKNAGIIFAAYLTGFFISYFIVWNYAIINREVSLYSEKGAYNTSGLNRIYRYYFSSLGLTTVIPVFVAIIIVPFIVKIVGIIANFIMACFFGLILLYEPPEAPTTAPDLPVDVIHPDTPVQNPAGNMLLYYILVIIASIIILTLIIVYRKKIKEFILFLLTKMALPDNDKNKIINQEIITEAKKEKKSKLSYKNYLKTAKKITGLRERFLFAYNYIFWGVIKKDEKLKESATPFEVAENYGETLDPAKLYQDLKYGQKPEEEIKTDDLKNMTNKAESFMQKYF